MATLSPTVPEHIPSHLVRDIDIYNVAGAEEDLHGAWKHLQSGPDIVWTPRNGGHWIVMRAKLLAELFPDFGRLSSRQVGIPITPMQVPPLPIQCDPPDHAGYRAVIQSSFTPKAVETYAVQARQLTIELIEGFRASVLGTAVDWAACTRSGLFFAVALWASVRFFMSIERRLADSL